MRPTQAAAVSAVQALIAEALAELGPRMAARPEPEFRDPEIQFVQAAQNTLRTCLEATFEAAIGACGGGHSERLHVELAIRLASYAISALPLESQDQALMTVIRTLPAAHSDRLAKGIVIQTEWDTHGVRHPNLPKGGA
jgi:hypothetical protein